MGEDDELGYLGDVTVDDDELGYLTAEAGYDYDSEANTAIGNYLATNFPELAGDATLTSQLGGALQKVGADAFNSLKKTFTNKDGSIENNNKGFKTRYKTSFKNN